MPTYTISLTDAQAALVSQDEAVQAVLSIADGRAEAEVLRVYRADLPAKAAVAATVAIEKGRLNAKENE
jgi:hypothetical protein